MAPLNEHREKSRNPRVFGHRDVAVVTRGSLANQANGKKQWTLDAWFAS